MKFSINYPKIITFMGFYLPLALLIIFVGGGICMQQRDNYLNTLKRDEIGQMKLESQMFESNLATYLADASSLASLINIELSRYLSTEDSYKVLANSFAAFVDNHREYDQIRYIGSSGMEQVRINRDINNKPETAPESLLQNKADRDYFIAAEKNKKSIYISAFDLNVEHRKIEIPHKPMIRVICPVNNSDGRWEGILILNVLGRKILKRLDRADKNSLGNIYLTNSKGNWLKGPNSESEWLFMFDENVSTSMGLDYPNAWQNIAGHKNGQFQNKAGLFTFITIDTSLLAEKFNLDIANIKAKEKWKIISLVPNYKLTPEWWPKAIWSLVCALAATALVSWVISSLFIARKKATAELIQNESQLNSITQTVLDAIIMIDEQRKIVFWNAAAESMFGYTAAEASQKDVHTLITPPELRTEATEGHAKFIRTGMGPIIGSKREVEAQRKDGTLFPAELHINSLSIKDRWWAVGVVRDITHRKEAELSILALNEELEDRVQRRTAELKEAIKVSDRREKLQNLLMDVASTANFASSLEEALSTTLVLINLYTGWPVGHVYFWSEKENMLVPSTIWQVSDDDKFNEFIKITESTKFEPGQGLPGIVYATQRTKWIENVATDKKFHRAKRMHEVNIHGAFGFPIFIGKKVAAVLEFYSEHATLPGGYLLEMAEQISFHLGHVIERKRIEAEIRRLALVAETTHNGVIITDKKGYIEWINEGFSKLTGYSLSEMIGKKPGELLQGPDTDTETITRISEALSRGESIREEILNYGKDGGSYWIELDIQPVFNESGEIEKYIAIQNDITQRKIATQELSRFKTTLDRTGDAVFIFDPETLIFTYANQGAMDQVGYTEEELLKLTPIDIKPKIDEKTFQEMVKPLKNFEISTLSFETVHKHKNGDLIPVDISLQYVHRKDEPSRFVAIVRDITESKRINAELKRAKEDAETATQVKSEFLANMSHEIRTPMNAIIGMSHILLNSELSTKQREQLGKILSASSSLLGVINDILDFSKIEASKLELESIPFDLDDVLHNLATVTRDKAEEKGLELIFDLGEDVPRLLIGDSLRLGQVLINLTSNSVKFTEKGSVKVKIEKVESGKRTTKLKFSVSDTGIGIAEEKQQELFKPFQQSDTSTTRKYGGTGLGLSISMRLIDMMGGEIKVSSSPGKGSTFYFTLDMSCQLEGCPFREVMDNFKGIHILVLDKSDPYKTIYENMLNSYGFESVFTEKLEHAEKLLVADEDQTTFDLLLINIDMLAPDGFDIRDRILEDKRYGDLKVLTVTAFPKQYSTSNPDRLPDLIKPISQSTLFDAIMVAMGKSSIYHKNKTIDEMVTQDELHALKGTRILVAEDNVFNQEVARELLEAVGVDVTVVENGAEAVEAVKEDIFDAVLMDMQMPVMNGFQAVDAIRNGLSNKKLPIIAMTAHAMKGDKEKSIEAGMNDHVTKPVDPKTLYLSLISCITDSDITDLNLNLKEPENSIVIPGIDTKRGLSRMAGNCDTYSRMLMQFAESRADSIKSIISDIENKDFEKACNAIHALKGVSGNLGIMEVYENMVELEKAVKDQNEEVTESLLEKGAQSITLAVESIKDFFKNENKNTPDKNKHSMSREEIRLHLEKLSDMLEDSDADASQLAEKLAEQVDDKELWASVQAIVKAVRLFEFDDALAALRTAFSVLDNKNMK